jgi:hypothetical protein
MARGSAAATTASSTVTIPDTYPLPNMMDFSSRVARCSIFTKIDLRKGYYRIPMHPADIITRSGS